MDSGQKRNLCVQRQIKFLIWDAYLHLVSVFKNLLSLQKFS